MSELFDISMGEPHDHLDWLVRVWANTGLHGIISTLVDRTLFATHTTLLSLKLKGRTVYSAAEALGYREDGWTFTDAEVPPMEPVETSAGVVLTSAMLVYIDCTGQKHIGCYRLLHDNGLSGPLPVFYRHLTHECTPLAVVACWKYADADEVSMYESQVNAMLDAAIAEREAAAARKVAERPAELKNGIFEVNDLLNNITITVAPGEEEPFMLVDFHLREFALREGITYTATSLSEATHQLNNQGIGLTVKTYVD